MVTNKNFSKEQKEIYELANYVLKAINYHEEIFYEESFEKNWWSVCFYNVKDKDYAVIVDTCEEGYEVGIDERGSLLDNLNSETKIYKTKNGVAKFVQKTLLGVN